MEGTQAKRFASGKEQHGQKLGESLGYPGWVSGKIDQGEKGRERLFPKRSQENRNNVHIPYLDRVMVTWLE